MTSAQRFETVKRSSLRLQNRSSRPPPTAPPPPPLSSAISASPTEEKSPLPSEKKSNETWCPPRISNTEYRLWINQCKDPLSEDQEALLTYHSTTFREWEAELRLGFNVILHGYGSKKKIMEMFFEYLTRHTRIPCWMVMGGHPEVQLKTLKSQLFEFLTSTFPPKSSVLKSTSLFTLLRQLDTPVFLIIHQLDSPMFRSPSTVAFMRSLLQYSQIHVIGSVDHLHATYLVSTLFDPFTCLYHHVTTFVPYNHEVGWQTHIGLLPTTLVTSTSIGTVLKSLPRHHQRCFQLLLVTNPPWISLMNWFTQCREEFLVADTFAFQSMLTEFLDHQVILVKTVDGGKLVKVNLDEQGRETLLEQMEFI
ncbi:Origin recognition complex subunit 2 [Coelomomyces lativittatus]|nr:Origin recognition complex subunit 2 [Coelomomyces lativittatus]KAJ1510815.1 Origin recognition complex subunit 2 [Coelomomyces lativittatus]KAJ1517746.1 Origin recognition complex subunit 2 [Coelomomyces lativittatus]